jgi:hypothetical protein
MKALFHLLSTYEVWIYVLLAAVGIVYLRKFVSAWIEWRGALFGLERNLAQRRLSEATSILSILLLLGLGEFVSITFVMPSLPVLHTLPTPTLNILAKATATIPPAATLTPANNGSMILSQDVAVTSSPQGCVKGSVEITSPKNGATIKGDVTLKGSAKITNFGFYKYEYKQPADTRWSTIQAGTEVRCPDISCGLVSTDTPNDTLGDWNTTNIAPGDYQLRLVVLDSQGVAAPACEIAVKVEAVVTP